MFENGFIKLYRPLLIRKELMDPVNLYILTHLLMHARFREAYIDGVEVKVNQVLISKQALADKLNLKLSQVRSTLATFERVGGISTENIRNRYTLITILEPYLTGSDASSEKSVRKADTKQKAPQTDFVTSAVAEINDSSVKTFSDNEDKAFSEKAFLSDEQNEIQTEIDTMDKKVYGEFNNVYMTDEEYERLCEMTYDPEYFINNLSGKLASGKEKDSPNHFALISVHVNNDKKKYPDKYSREAFEKAKRTKELQQIEEKSYHKVPKVQKRQR